MRIRTAFHRRGHQNNNNKNKNNANCNINTTTNLTGPGSHGHGHGQLATLATHPTRTVQSLGVGIGTAWFDPNGIAIVLSLKLLQDEGQVSVSSTTPSQVVISSSHIPNSDNRFHSKRARKVYITLIRPPSNKPVCP